MSVTDILILPSTEAAPAILGQGDDVREIMLSGLQTVSPMAELCIVLPGQMVRSYVTELPKVSRAQQLKAARFAHEDKVAAPLESLHVALSETEPKAAALISQSDLESILTALRDAGHHTKMALVDYQAFAALNGPRHFIDRVIVPGIEGRAVDADWFEGDAETLSAQDAVALVRGHLTTPTLNLLQGEYRAKSALGNAGRSWAKLGALAAACIAAFFALQIAELRNVKNQTQQLRTQSAALYTERTGQPAPDNPAAAIARAQDLPNADRQAFLQLSQILFTALSAHEDIVLERLDFDARRNELQLRLNYPDFEAAARTEAAVIAAGGAFETGGVREQSGQFIGEAVLRVGGGS